MTYWERRLHYLLDKEDSYLLFSLYQRIKNAVNSNNIQEVHNLRKELWIYDIPLEMENYFKRIMNKLSNYSTIIDMEQRISQLLKRQKQKSGRSFRDIAESTGVNISYIYKLYDGQQNNPSLPIVASIAETFGINILDLLKSLLGDTYFEHLQNNKIKEGKDSVQSIEEISYEAITNPSFVSLIKAIHESEWTAETKEEDLKNIAIYIDTFKNSKRLF